MEKMEGMGWRDGEARMDRWRDEGMEGWRDGMDRGMWRDMDG